MPREKLYSRLVIGDLGEPFAPVEAVVTHVELSLRALDSLTPKVDWSTLTVTVGPDDLFPGHAVVTTRALTKEE